MIVASPKTIVERAADQSKILAVSDRIDDMTRRGLKAAASRSRSDKDQLHVVAKAARICAAYSDYHRARCYLTLSESTQRAAKRVKSAKVRTEMEYLADDFREQAERFYRKERQRHR